MTQSSDNNQMKGSSWVILECLIILTAFGIASFFIEPKYGYGVLAVLTAVIAVLNQAIGAKSGSTMPQQASDPKQGQSTQTTSTSTTKTDTADPANP